MLAERREDDRAVDAGAAIVLCAAALLGLPKTAALGNVGGLVWCIGRVIYALAYYKDPAKRTAGFTIAVGASGLLMLGTAVGLLTN